MTFRKMANVIKPTIISPTSDSCTTVSTGALVVAHVTVTVDTARPRPQSDWC